MIVGYIALAEMMLNAGFPPGEKLVTGIAVVAAESGRDPAAKHVNEDEWHSIDRGMWMLNNHWHPEVSDECAYDAECSTREALRISLRGADYSPWSAYTNDSYMKNIAAARVAADGAAKLRAAAARQASLQAKIDAAKAALG